MPTTAPQTTSKPGMAGAMAGAGTVSRWLAWLGGAMLLLSAGLVSLDVIFRALLKATYFESFELSTYAFAIATALGMSYALVSRAHIRIEVVYMMFGVRTRAWLDVVAYIALSVCAVATLYWCGQTVLGNLQSGARSNSSMAVPLAIPQGIWLLGLAWFALLAVMYAVYGLWKCLTGQPEAAHHRLGVASLEEEIDANVAKENAA